MLLELQISDFAIIETLHLRLETGFTALTGETGAGKSIVIDALGTLRGEKVTPDLVRAGSERARIEGIFSLADSPDLIPLLQTYDLWDEEGEQLILTREISAQSGRSVARINRRAVNMGILRDIGGRLVDIHGQHEGLSIFNARTHLDMLDRYGGLFPMRQEVSTMVEHLRHLQTELTTLRQNEEQRTERIEELRALLDDVQAAELRAEEEHDLVQERSVLQHAARIAELVDNAYTTLSTNEEHGAYTKRPVIELMAKVASNLDELARLDPAAAALGDQATDLHYRLEDLATNLRAYYDRFDFDPTRLDAIEERLFLIRTMQRKYGSDIPTLLERAAQAETEIDQLTHSSDHITQVEAQQSALLAELGTQAGKLSRQRRATGDKLSQAIEGAMGDLAMPHVRFAVQVEQVEEQRGVPVATENAPPDTPPRTCQVSSTGIDRVEFLLSPNPGEPLKPLVHIASGGESARLLLALKSILSEVDTVPTLVFDEVDVGVGGRAGQVIGQKLWNMTTNHQVLCITHLAQVAAFAETHYAISKVVETSPGGTLKTHTNLRCLSEEERVDELAAMLGGTPVSEPSRASAREIIERANAMKSGEKSSCKDR
jgi:DNA repair protein RecN (Recombination protein N)